MKTKEEFDLSKDIEKLDKKVMNNEISLLTYLNLRIELDKSFIRILKEEVKPIKDTQEYMISNLYFVNLINELAGENLI